MKPIKVPTLQGLRELEVIAEKNGVKALPVLPLANGSIMPSDQRKKLEAAVTPRNAGEVARMDKRVLSGMVLRHADRGLQ